MATQIVNAKYEEIIDLHTESNTVTALGIHTPTGDTPQKMFPGFFKQFKKYKYRGASVMFVPVATLPADPSQVSYEAGEPGIDPRDLANPILVKGCHGDDLGTILNTVYNSQKVFDSVDGDSNIVSAGQVSADNLTSLYYRALTDRTWKKANVQRGFKKAGLRPLVYNVVANHQIMPGIDPMDYDLGSPEMEEVDMGDAFPDAFDVKMPISTSKDLRMMTNRLTGLGWIDTRNELVPPTTLTMDSLVAKYPKLSGESDGHWFRRLAEMAGLERENYTQLEKIFMLMVLLPPSYKQEMYFRVIITHYFAFKGFRGVSLQNDMLDVPTYRNGNDDMFDSDDGLVPGGRPN